MITLPEEKRVELETTLFFRRKTAADAQADGSVQVELICKPSQPVIQTDWQRDEKPAGRDLLIPI